MSSHRVPADANLSEFFRLNVGDGDRVYLAEGATYETWGLNFRGLHGIRLQPNGARIKQRSDAPPQPILRLTDCNGWHVYTPLHLQGTWRPGLANDRARFEGHAVALQGCQGIYMVAPYMQDAWGDAEYIAHQDEGQTSRDIVICDPTWDHVGRHGSTTVQGEDIVIYRPHVKDVARTAFNFEVHPGELVRNWVCEDARVDRAGLRVITRTGAGDTVGVSFRGMSLPLTQRFTCEVYGTGADQFEPVAERDYGQAKDWEVVGVRGGMAPKAGRVDARFVCVDGLRLETPFPCDTRGSTY